VKEENEVGRREGEKLMQVGGQGGGERAEPSEISRCCSRLSESMDARTTMAVEVQSEGLKKLRAFPSLSSPRSALRPLSFIVKVKLLAGVQLWPAARRRCPPSCSFPFPSRPRSSHYCARRAAGDNRD
jgi:hypothetical protein